MDSKASKTMTMIAIAGSAWAFDEVAPDGGVDVVIGAGAMVAVAVKKTEMF